MTESRSSTTSSSGRSASASAAWRRYSAARLVDGVSQPVGSISAAVPRSACARSAPRNACWRTLRLTLPPKLRGVGPNVTPPPVQWGARIEPWRARPVPFWRHGFAPPPRTSPRVFVEAELARRAASSATTVSWMMCCLMG